LNITETLFAETRKQALQDLILNAILGHLRSDNAAIYQRNPGESQIRLVQAIGRAIPAEDISAGPGILSRADQWKIPIWVNSQGPGESEFKQLLETNDFSGLVCVPVVRGDGSLIFTAARNAGEPGYGVVDIELFGLLARQADVALENAHLYEELRAYVRQIEQSQRALIQAEKMSAVGRLTASIAHEVNNPLQAVQNCLHLADREELSKEKRAEYMDMAKEELDRLMNTVQRMLDFYRPGALQKKHTNVSDLIQKVLALLEKQLSSANVDVEVDLGKDLPEVRVVQNQMQQVFFNLVLNAMDAMKNGGKLKIYTRLEKARLSIFFEDNGPGVPVEVRDNIFEPFTSTSEDGTGLGLSVSYGILTAHGGSLELVEGTEHGACFKVSIPLEVT
jgi:signal transduction histidine kinase